MAPTTTPIVEQRNTRPQWRKVSLTPSIQPLPMLTPVLEMLGLPPHEVDDLGNGKQAERDDRERRSIEQVGEIAGEPLRAGGRRGADHAGEQAEPAGRKAL